MKHIFLNLKRFDIPRERGGVNSLAPIDKWAAAIVGGTQEALRGYSPGGVEFVAFFPEAHLLAARAALSEDSPLQLGSQGVFRDDTAVGGNFGAFTTNRPANAIAAMGMGYTLIGHCEERRDKLGILQEAGVEDHDAVGRLLNKEIRCAQAAGLKVLFCVGETTEQQPRWQETLESQLALGLNGIDTGSVVIAYEPVWAIGPGKTPPGKEYIEMVAGFIKEKTCGLPVVYGGGLNSGNAAMLASIPEIDGGFIALTRFTGDIGFYPDEYLEIVATYLGK